MKKAFEQAKQSCISCCKNYNLKTITYRIFKQQEVIKFFLKQEEKDEAYQVILDVSKRYLKDKKGSILIPGSGTGGLSRRIAKQFHKFSILQFDSSQLMTKIAKNESKSFKNIITLQDEIDHYTKNGGKGTFSMIIMYGVWRYISMRSKRIVLKRLIGLLASGGVLLIGEGGAPDIIHSIPDMTNALQQEHAKTARLFRCSLFYHLLDMYGTDDSFKHKIKIYAKQKDIRYTDVLEQIAGYKKDKVYIKLFIKK